MLFTPRNPNLHLWDSWLLKRGDDFHLFHLMKRTGESSSMINHAVSKDLAIWEEKGPIIQRGKPGEWDAGGLNTGITVHHDGKYYLFYGALVDGVQRIGVAISTDLVNWEKYDGSPVLEIDPRWYQAEILDASEPGVSWRDPCIVQDETGLFHAFLCARAKTGVWAAKGAIGHATSKDLLHWDVHPPVYVSDRHGFIEVPDVFRLGDRWFIIFSTGQWHTTRTADADYAASGMRYLIGESMLGPYYEPEESSLLSTGLGVLGAYAGRTISLEGEDHLMRRMVASSRLFYYHNAFRTDFLKFTFKGSWGLPKLLTQNEGVPSLGYYPKAILGLTSQDTVSLDAGEFSEFYPGVQGTGIEWNKSGQGLSGYCPGGSATVLARHKVADGIWQVKVSLASGGAAGILFRYDHESREGLALTIDATRQRVELLRIYKAEFGWTSCIEQYRPLAVDCDRAYMIRVVARDCFVDAYVDDQAMFSLSVEANKQGKTGLYLENARALFGSVSVEPMAGAGR